jgi:predicted ATP-dependent endonuclease of OLD family
MQLTRFRVVGLHGRKTMDVQIQDNKLVLVGENGTGKSTFANLIYYFLTKQWRRLHEYRFAAIEAVLAGEELTVTPSQIEAHFATIERASLIARRFSPRMARSLEARLAEYWQRDIVLEPEQLVLWLSEEERIPRAIVQQFLRDFEKRTKGKPGELQVIEEKISSQALGQFLYLPTYRRIEQDLKSIFRGADLEPELRKVRDRLTRREGAPFIELVEFGMEDVGQTIGNRMTQIKESVRNGLDNLTGTYLRDVIRGIHSTVDVQRVRSIDPKTLDAVFARIDESTLPTSDKTHLKDTVATISATQEIKDADKVIAHFLLKLVELYSDQQAGEKDVRSFVELCNQYLTGKQLVYDNTKYTVFIRLEGQDSTATETLEMQKLSSGEKQIVSLFCQLYLSRHETFFVVIDEPELSLSVPWQRRFLPDIVNTGMSTGLVAVTHSPFVWDNELEPFVRSLAEFTEAYHDVH